MITDTNIPPQEAARNQDLHVDKEAVKRSASSVPGWRKSAVLLLWPGRFKPEK